MSALDWWDEAGVDTLVDEFPRDWLARATPVPSAIEPPAETPPAPALALPGDLAAFRSWLLADAAVPGRATIRLDAIGDPASGTMILIDMPEAEDRTARALLSGETGELFDRMLGAMGLSREGVYLAPFSPARSPTGSLDATAIAALLPIQRHHIALVAPRRLLLMGEAPTRALLNSDSNAARGKAHGIAIGDRELPVITTFPPRMVTLADSAEEKKSRRALIWADLQLFMAL